MKAVFVLHHSHRVDGYDEVKFIGVYALRKDAQLAVRRMRRQPGFCKYPRGFHIDKYELGRDHWEEGFVSS